jgi:hypothetical protein
VLRRVTVEVIFKEDEYCMISLTWGVQNSQVQRLEVWVGVCQALGMGSDESESVKSQLNKIHNF